MFNGQYRVLKNKEINLTDKHIYYTDLYAINKNSVRLRNCYHDVIIVLLNDRILKV